ncbi:MAG TPA: glycerol-3-phosphate 1-O-acyltransferase PlsY [Clostridia bacterium]|nr:glycerol-3-phosphate 1-O-acyltransferase PlsY [Clostridia bacterium]
MKSVLVIVASYIIGSIPIGYLVATYLKGIDISKYGSGNIGATNIWRTLGPVAGTGVFAGDVLKGVVAVTLAKPISPEIVVLAAFAVLAGHSWSVFLGFKGGKAIATGFGVILSIAVIPALIAIPIWGGIVAITGYVSLGSIIAAVSVPIMMIFLKSPWQYVLTALVLVAIALYRHKDNIKRLLNGTENRFNTPFVKRRNLR